MLVKRVLSPMLSAADYDGEQVASESALLFA